MCYALKKMEVQYCFNQAAADWFFGFVELKEIPFSDGVSYCHIPVNKLNES